LSFSLAQTDLLDPPTMLWAETHGSYFNDVHQTSDLNFIIAGREGEGPDKSVFMFDPDGSLIWEFGISGYDYYQQGIWVEELPGGDFIATGTCRPSSSSDYALFLAKLDANGEEEWVRIYDIAESNEYGYCVLLLPDGGFLVTGRANGSGAYLGQAWILRTDANGDTLWTDIWGEHTVNWARRSLFINDSLKVLTYGRIHPDSSRGPHILTYDMNGILTRETLVQELEDEKAPDMCFSTLDDCFTLITSYHPQIAHVDDLGNLLWSGYLPGYGFNYGVSINGTMDGGYVYGGYNTPNPDHPWEQVSGMIVKYSSSGGVQWGDYIYEEDCAEINSVRQLSQGGYIAAGMSWSFELGARGLLIRYAPEVGIEEGSTLPASVILRNPSPNPFTTNLSIGYSLPESMHISLSVFDLSGRMVGELEEAVLPSGDHTSIWSPGDLSSGCYVVRLLTDEGVLTESCVLVR